jgi:S-adenosylmethionine:tRNA ribosyltransferase-isomerase
MTALDFVVPAELSAGAPRQPRDDVRLLVARPDGVRHIRFGELAAALAPGDLVVVNTSATLAAAVDGMLGARAVTVHFATALDDSDWVVEIRPRQNAGGPLEGVRRGDRVELPHDVRLTVRAPQPAGQVRLWRATVPVEAGDVPGYLSQVGRPIRYAYVREQFPLADYQTVFGRRPGSAEMPSAGRPFTDALVTDLVTAGVAVAPILLHAGVSSPSAGEPPQPERYEVSEPAARLVNLTRAWGNRVVAVGTTVTRALESAADDRGVVRARSGWTDLVLGPERPARVVGGLVTGWHEPGASHLRLLEAVAGPDLVRRAYEAALAERYRWHEFGDSCLLLP